MKLPTLDVSFERQRRWCLLVFAGVSGSHIFRYSTNRAETL